MDMIEEKKEKQPYFQEALADFTHDAASGQAIRHLASLGYTTDQIMKELAYPTPRRRVEQTVARYMKETGILLTELPIPEEQFSQIILRRPGGQQASDGQPDSGEELPRGLFEGLFGAEGKAHSCGQPDSGEELPRGLFGGLFGAAGKVHSRTRRRHLAQTGAVPDPGAWAASLAEELQSRIKGNGPDHSYISCPFGMIRRDREARLNRMLAPLTSREKEYILGIDWEMRMMYHRLNSRMLEIGIQLAAYGETEYSFYFLKSRQRIVVQ